MLYFNMFHSSNLRKLLLSMQMIVILMVFYTIITVYRSVSRGRCMRMHLTTSGVRFYKFYECGSYQVRLETAAAVCPPGIRGIKEEEKC